MPMKNRLRNDPFYRHIFRLVLPIVIQNLLSAAVSSADVVMLNYVGQSSISAGPRRSCTWIRTSSSGRSKGLHR